MCILQAGGPFYPLYTGRRDGSNSFADIATYELPSPYGDLSQTLTSFQSRGFDEREMVTLLGEFLVILSPSLCTNVKTKVFLSYSLFIFTSAEVADMGCPMFPLGSSQRNCIFQLGQGSFSVSLSLKEASNGM